MVKGDVMDERDDDVESLYDLRKSCPPDVPYVRSVQGIAKTKWPPVKIYDD
jgi:hypothetical protein